MPIRYPQPLRPGDVVGVTSPSSGVARELHGRLEVALRAIESRGYRVQLGECMAGEGIVSAPAEQRAAELTGMLRDPAVRAIVPPWGGELAIDLLPHLDFAAIAAAEPTWFVGYSDTATLITPLTVLTGIATVHGNNLMDTPYRPAAGTVSWLDLVTLDAGASVSQISPGRFRSSGWDDYARDPGVDRMSLDATGTWERLDAEGDATFAGRLIGGCIETLCNLAGTSYGDTTAFADRHAPEGLVVYVEAAEDGAATICRNLHGMRLAGFFKRANGILVGRTHAPGSSGLSQREAVLDALGTLGVPIIADVECGHVQPFLPLVNGALASVDTATRTIVQQLK